MGQTRGGVPGVSRVPTGTPVSVSLLGRIGQAEQALRDLGFDNLRVRHHGELAQSN